MLKFMSFMKILIKTTQNEYAKHNYSKNIMMWVGNFICVVNTYSMFLLQVNKSKKNQHVNTIDFWMVK